MHTQEYKVKVEMTLEQARFLVEALDLYSRIGIGQFGEIAHHYEHLVKNASERAGTTIGAYDVGVQIEKALRFLMPESFFGSCSYGISHPEVTKKAKLAFDMLQPIRYQLAWHRCPEGGVGCHFDAPFFYTDEKPIKVLIQRD